MRQFPVSSYRMLSFAAIAATALLVACAPDGELLETASAIGDPQPLIRSPSSGVATPNSPVPAT